jgi:hypothetical protein
MIMDNNCMQVEKESMGIKNYNIHTVELEGEIYPMGYRVVTEDMESLGLRENPNIIKYPIGEWFVLPSEEVEEWIGDWGGIWLARTPSKAKEYKRYMKEKHGTQAKVFKAAIGEILFCNSGRIKTDAIFIFEEILLED